MFKNLSGFWPVYKVYIGNLMPSIGEYDWAVERVFELRKIEGGFWFISPPYNSQKNSNPTPTLIAHQTSEYLFTYF